MTKLQRLLALEAALIVAEDCFQGYPETQQIVFMNTDQHNTRQLLLSASGYCYHSGTRTLDEFRELYGFHPLNYPEFFLVTKYKRVCVHEQFREWCKDQFQMVHNNYARLGLRCGNSQ